MNDSPYADRRVASIYKRVAAPFQFDLPARDLVRLLRPRKGARLLDVGAGTGAVALRTSRAVGSGGVVIGVDAAIEMLRVTRTTATYIHAVAQVPRLPFADSVFDGVTAGFVVSHFADYGRGLADIVRVCRSGGRVGMTSWGAAPNPVAQLWSEIAGQYMPTERLDEAFRAYVPWHEWFSRPDNVRQALQDAGLMSVGIETRQYRFTLTTSDYLVWSETSVQGIALRRACSSAQWTDFSRRVAGALRDRFGDTVECVRDVHFGVGTKNSYK